MYLDVTCVFICSLKHTSCKHTSCAAAFIFDSPSQKESLRLEAPKRHPSFPTGSHSLCSNRGCDLLWKILLTKIDLIRSTSLASVFFSSRRGQILDMLSCGIFSHWSRADSTQPHLAPRSVSQVSGELTGLQPGWWRNMRSGN